jgi:hypothetical protein
VPQVLQVLQVSQELRVNNRPQKSLNRVHESLPQQLVAQPVLQVGVQPQLEK